MRQPSSSRLSRGPSGSPGRLTGGDPRAPLLAAGVAVLFVLAWLLFLPPFSLLRGGGGWQDAGEDSLLRRKSETPKAPDGFQLAGPYYEIRSRQDRGVGPAMMTIPLGDGKGGRGLSLWTWNGGKWERLGGAEVTSDGRSARGQVDRVPDNVAVMRRTGGGFVVQGILAPGATLHPDADKLVNTRSPADFVPVADGSLVGEPSPGTGSDAVALVPVVRATGGSEAQAVNGLLAGEAARAHHVDELVRLVQANRLDGLDLEYTAIEPSLGGAFNALVSAVADQLHKTGQTLTVTLPLPRREANNWNTYGYDWKEIGRFADYVRIPPERDQSIYRRTVRDALNFVTGQVDPKKIILTVSPLAVEKSEQGLRTLTTLEALSAAAQITVRDRDKAVAGADLTISADNLNREGAPAGLIWDATAAAVSFVYQSGEALRTVWIENVFSTAFKLEYVQLWGLGGVAVDDAADTAGMANIWPAIAQCSSTCAPVLLQPNSGLLRPQWLADGKPVEAGKAVFTWKAPDPGDHTIELIVGDGVVRVKNQTKITLRAGPVPSPTAVASPTPARR